jgi:hypothetical protein
MNVEAKCLNVSSAEAELRRKFHLQRVHYQQLPARDSASTSPDTD